MNLDKIMGILLCERYSVKNLTIQAQESFITIAQIFKEENSKLASSIFKVDSTKSEKVTGSYYSSKLLRGQLSSKTGKSTYVSMKIPLSHYSDEK